MKHAKPMRGIGIVPQGLWVPNRQSSHHHSAIAKNSHGFGAGKLTFAIFARILRTAKKLV
jgi:hypothetical protein